VVGDWLAGLEAITLSRALRDSVWIYPLVNAGHLLGIALLIGSIVPLDLRLLGFWRSQSIAPLWNVLTRVAAFGLALAAICGVLLFITRATEYAASGFFLAKMAVVGTAGANALVLRWIGPVRLSNGWPLPRYVRFSAAVSLVAWITALILGRLVGYF
jgi:hypothetical protein